MGRERELEELLRVLPGARMLTLTGSGGSGKTSLAVEAARNAAGDFRDGAWLAELAPVSDAGLVPGAVAGALGVVEEHGRPFKDALADFLRGKQLLAVLDNCEHVRDGAGELCDHLLRHCPEVRILATSREPLGVEGELNVPVPPLAVPEEGADAQAVGASEAGTLFLDRARAVSPGIQVDDSNAAWVASICRRLDGIPLAIELAAARVGVLTPQEIDEHLDDRFRLLISDSRTALPRHQTLGALIDWSHDLLGEDDAVLYRRLGVFVGGFTLEAAERVCSGEPLSPKSMLDGLARLVDKSLVVPEEQEGRNRYRMLETVREHALDRLRASKEEEVVRSRHAAWFVTLIERSEPDLAGPRQVEVGRRLEREFANLRSALGWSLGSGNIDSALRLVGVRRFWQSAQGHTEEGRAWVDEVLPRAGEADPSLRARALGQAGEFRRVQGDLDEARTFMEQALEIQRELPDPTPLGQTLLTLGRVESAAGRNERAKKVTRESVAIARAAGNLQKLGERLAQLGEITYDRRDREGARPLLEEALRLAREAGDAHTIADALRVMGMIERDAGHPEVARAFVEEALVLQRELSDWACVSVSMSVLGDIALRRREPARAAGLFAESLALQRRAGLWYRLVDSLWGLGASAAGQGQLVRAARLLGAEQRVRSETAVPFRLASVEQRESVLTALRHRMDDATFGAEWQFGMAMRRDEALAYALAEHEPEEATIGVSAAEPAGTPAPSMFRREGEYWTVVFEEDAFRLKDTRGLRYLARLLSEPGREFHALDLVMSEGDRSVPGAAGGGEARSRADALGHGGEALDSQAKAAYRSRLLEIEEELADAEALGDSHRSERARTEREFLADQLAAAVGLGGRDRVAASASERARLNVTRAIRTALTRIEEHSPALGRHLEATVRTGTFCSYTPDPRLTVTWQL